MTSIFYAGICLGLLLGALGVRVWDWIWAVPPEPHFTSDGGHLCPYEGMTDADLDDFERDMEVPMRTFPCCKPCCKEKAQESHE
jgi:hypothetical protein